MKYFYLILPAALTFCACQSDLTEDMPNASSSAPTLSLNTRSEVSYPQPDGSVALSTDPATAVWQLMQKADPNQALQVGETDITDAEMAEIKQFVDQNLKEEGQYKTYLNIFEWIVKNMTYAWSGEAYLRPYDVFKYKRCVCQGYANLLKVMCISQGIPCAVANGWLGYGDGNIIGGHAWNYVYADGDWYVSDPTNNQEFKGSDVTGYQKKLIPIRLDFTLFEDDQFTYNYQNSQLNVCSVKPTTSSSITVPYGAGGIRITSFQPQTTIPASITQLNVGANITSFGDNPSSLERICPNIEEVNIDPTNKELESYKGVVYRLGDEYPYYIPAGIRRIELRPMEIMDKNVISFLPNLEEVVVADGTKRIEEYAIEQCPNLKRVIVPASVEYISPQAFVDCGNVEVVRTSTGIHEVRM